MATEDRRGEEEMIKVVVVYILWLIVLAVGVCVDLAAMRFFGWTPLSLPMWVASFVVALPLTFGVQFLLLPRLFGRKK